MDSQGQKQNMVLPAVLVLGLLTFLLLGGSFFIKYLEEQIFLTLYMIFKTSQNQHQSLVRLETHIFAQCENMQSQIAAQIKN